MLAPAIFQPGARGRRTQAQPGARGRRTEAFVTDSVF